MVKSWEQEPWEAEPAVGTVSLSFPDLLGLALMYALPMYNGMSLGISNLVVWWV